MNVKQTIEQKLTNAFSPSFLEIRDDSHLHAGHVGARPEGETHFHVTIQATSLSHQSRVGAQRMIYQVLADELAGPVHALSLKVQSN